MAIITYDQWMKDTARIGLTRSPELKAIDAAFLNHEKLGTSASRDALEKAFEAWKKKEGTGDAWRKSSRNHSRAADKLDGLLKGLGDDDSAFSMGRAPDFMHEDLINARLGVLYLFSRLTVVPGLFKLVLEGGLDIAGQAMEIGEVDDGVQSKFGKASKVANPVGGKGLDFIEDKLVKQVAPKNMSLAPNAKPSILAGEHATTVTSEQIQRDAAAAAQLANRPMVQKIRDQIQKWFDMLVEKVISMLKQKFGTLEGIAGMAKMVIKGLVTLVAAKAAPFVGGALEVVSAVGKTLDASVTRFQTWRDGRNVEVAQGHPATIVDSITRAMTLSVFEGLWGVLKGAGALAMDGVGFGAGGIVNLCISAGELLIKFLWRLAETIRFNSFCAVARGHWENQHSADAIHRQPFAFSEWYRGTALNLPLIPVLTLNTGICGDKMRYLTMFKAGGGTPISTNEFQAGVRFLDNLKPWGAKYIEDTGYKIRSAGDVLVDNLVNTFATSHEKEKTAFDHVITIMTA